MKMQWIVALMGTALLGTALVAAVPAPAWAHTDAYFDANPSPHGGQRRMSGPYHIELVTSRPGEITVYVANHADDPIATAGGEGKAVVRSGNGETTATIVLTPVENNILKGKGEFKLEQDSTVTVFVKLPGQEAWGAEFTPLKPKANASTDGDHDEDGDDHDHDHEHHHAD